MSGLATTQDRVPASSAGAVSRVRHYEAIANELPQLELATHHTLHGGMYARTICIPAGAVLTGAFIRVPTLLVLEGHVTVTLDDEDVTLAGYHVLAASAGRKQAFLTHEDTRLTMVFATRATTVAEAEDEFTDEAHLLCSRKPGAVNHINITGE